MYSLTRYMNIHYTNGIRVELYMVLVSYTVLLHNCEGNYKNTCLQIIHSQELNCYVYSDDITKESQWKALLTVMSDIACKPLTSEANLQGLHMLKVRVTKHVFVVWFA